MNLDIYSPKIKICGIQTTDILRTCIDAGADMVGFVYFDKSPRHIDLIEILKLTALSYGKIETVVLTVNPSDDLLKKIDAIKPNWLQLHGNESVERIKEIKQITGVKIIKALPIGTSEDVKNIAHYYDVADLIILDAKPPKNSSRPGGLGKSFDWDLLKTLDPSIKYMLSGGLNVQNVGDSVLNLKPYGIDVSSGVEINADIKDKNGIKDKNKIIDFIKIARQSATK